MSIQKFKDFPEAYPHYPEKDLPSLKAKSRILLKTNTRAARALNQKIGHSRTYYDLAAIHEHGGSPDREHLDRLNKGFMSQNSTVYQNKGEGNRRGYFTDPDSRWFGLTRPEAREMILDEILSSKDEGLGNIPTTPSDAASAQGNGMSKWLLPAGGLLVAVGLGYGIHRLMASQDTN